MKLALTADIHGNLSHLIPAEPVDVLCIAGDLVPTWAPNKHDVLNLKRQADWMLQHFYPTLTDIRDQGLAKSIVYTWGNHDWIGFYAKRVELPTNFSHIHCLNDSGVEIAGINFWGSPWQPRFHDWAFNLDEPELKQKWDLIPTSTDVLIVHGPPNGKGDRVGHQNCGSPSLNKRLKIVEPQLVVCGHIHVGAGVYSIQGNSGHSFHVYNVAAVDERYYPVRYPIITEIPDALPV